MHAVRRTSWLLLTGLVLALGLAGCQSRPELDLTHMRPATVGEARPDVSFWGETVTYPFEVKYSTARDERGVEWEFAYMDEFIGEDISKAPTLVLVHGKGAAAGYWSELMETALEAGLRVVALDIPGYGKSIPGNLDAPLARTFEDTRQAWHRIASDELNIDNATYLGHSMGGQWVIGYTLSYPDAVDKLIVAATAGFEEYPRNITLPGGEVPWMDPVYAHDYDTWNETWAFTGRLDRERNTTEQQIRDFYYFKKRDPNTGEVTESDVGFFKKDGPDARWLTEARVGMIDGPQEELELWVIAYTRDIYSMGMELNREDPNSLFKRLTEIDIPVFIAFGADEPLIPTTVATGNTDLRNEVIKPAYMKLAEQGPKPVVKLYEGVGHFIHTDVPETFNNDVVDFVYNGRVSGPTEDPAKYEAAAVELPADVAAFVEADETAVRSGDVAAIMANYHPDFQSDGRDYEAQTNLYKTYGNQLKAKYEVEITGLEIEGDKALVDGAITTSFGKANLKGTYLIKEDGKWMWYGNRK
ncbi:alpha/beta fold hydrolase [Alkalilimnicola sp. S0819]|uniref:alpha/beta fold hydrolase n=1 Tax=Alkalilimnicola sp. S0819 TaxID=2613922 RepID=UPI001261A365|nr:alpha/beta hydrolase [Alkalilimnicola sp. S0819]KAB7619530.1 alpha/beta fold hydrolase [Alkalilimnicola sp. S0819]MPQ17637.1 alpha/beta fold hydrolase [Alkalilimnicola sp. S0819]